MNPQVGCSGQIGIAGRDPRVLRRAQPLRAAPDLCPTPNQAEAILACDFLETVTPSGQRQYVLAVIEHATRRIRVLGATAHPTASWVVQAARNLVVDLEDAGSSIRYLIRDRDGKFCAAFDEVLADAGVQVVLTGVRMPRINAVMERWVGTCRRELLDRMLIWNQVYLLHALREFENHYNLRRPHRSLDQRALLHPAPEPITGRPICTSPES